MGTNSRVVWSEGMFLRPQHFQQQARHIDRILHQRVEPVRSFGWGVTAFQIDKAALNIGKFGISSASGVLDDGTPFAIPEDVPAPPPIDVPETTRNQRVCLVLPLARQGLPDTVVGERDEVAARFAASEYDAADSVVGSDIVAPVSVGKPRLRFAIEGFGDLGGFSTLPIARIIEMRGDSKQVVVDDQYIPPAMSIEASPPLTSFAVELHGLLHNRAEAIAARLAQPSMRGAAEMTNLLLLQVANKYAPLAAHIAQTPTPHPQDWYGLLVSMAGELATFTSQRRRPVEFPSYRHDDLQKTFEPVIAALRQALSAVLEQGAVQIPLQERRYGVHVGVIQDKTLLRTAPFVLAVRAEITPDALRRTFPASVKIGPVEQIVQLVNVALPGIKLAPLPVAPPQLPFNASTVYFELDRSSEFFRGLATSGGIAIHVGGEWPKLAMELWAIRQQS
ncbi:MAG: type VI secretion system baseplate subunit TssK [Rhodospirillales bacterium]|nr:MAG: type VI secretion system baseplate subunit TssK [Rhodospirillales bacterium]